MRESKVEAYFNQQVKAVGGLTRKLKWGNQRNAPDRIAFFPYHPFFPTGATWLVELKATGEKPRAAQLREHERLRTAGANVITLSTFQEVDEFIKGVVAAGTQSPLNQKRIADAVATYGGAFDGSTKGLLSNLEI